MQEIASLLYWLPGYAAFVRAYHRLLRRASTDSGMGVARRASTAGQGLVEYALIIALVAVVVIATLILLGPQIASIFKKISNNL